MPKEDQNAFNKSITKWQANKGNLEFLKELTQLRQQKYIISLKKLIYRPKAGTLRAKQLEKLKQEEDFKVPIQFAKKKHRYIL